MFEKKVKEAEVRCIPRKIVKTGKRKFSCTLDRKSLAKRKKKHRLWKRYLESKDGKVYEEYCRCRNQVRRMTRRAIKLHEKDIAKKAKLNNKAFWKFINSKTKLRSTIPDLYTSNDLDKQKMTKNDHEKSNKLAEYFSTVYTTEPDFSWVLQEEEKPIIKEKLDIVITREIVKK